MSDRGVLAPLTAAATARACYAAVSWRPPKGRHAWTRTNHRGEPITLLEGPAVAVGGIVGALCARGAGRPEKIAMAAAGLGAAAFGSYDDLAGDAEVRGFRGHLGALRRGRLTTGTVKIAGLGATGLLAALIAGGQAAGGRKVTAGDVVVNTGLVAGMANVINLFDLRPGRAIKAAIGTSGLLAALPGGGGQASLAPVAAAVALLPEDLGERSMLGDAGANAVGAMLGVAATRLPWRGRVAALAVVAGLAAASEIVSFTRVIEQTAPLRWLDSLGRRPQPPRSPRPGSGGTPAATVVHDAAEMSGAVSARPPGGPAAATATADR